MTADPSAVTRLRTALRRDGGGWHSLADALHTAGVATYSDVGDIDVSWIDEDDEHVNPIGTKGVGEIGIVGTAAAVANAVWHATGIRVRDLPVRLDKLLR